MKILSSTMFLTIIILSSYKGVAQKKDTIQISSININTKVLREGTHRYLVYFKMAKDSVRTQTQFWTRTIKRTDYNGTPAIKITQEWEDKDSIMHIVKSISDAKTMQPLYHKTWWKVQTSRTATVKTVNVTTIDFLNKTVDYNGKSLSDADTAKQAVAIWAGYKSSLNKYFLNWHLDLETFPILPYKNGVTFVIPFYDPGTASTELEIYADDVVCGHGSTSAEIDPDLVFYCMSRGISLDDARRLLIESFSGEAIEKVQDAGLRDALSDKFRSHLHRVLAAT